jgi:hypothetical protein
LPIFDQARVLEMFIHTITMLDSPANIVVLATGRFLTSLSRTKNSKHLETD